MTGSIRHIVDDRWQVVVYAGRDPHTNKERYRTRAYRADNKREAEKLADPIKTALRAEVEQGKKDRKTVAGYVDAWLREAEHDKSPTTMKGYRQIAAAIVKRFGRMKLDELKPSDVRAWYAHLRAGGMTPATVRHYAAVLNIVCRQAWADGEVVKPATFGVKLPTAVRKGLSLPTDQAMMAIVSHGDGDLRVAFMLAAATGMRRGELVALRWSDLRGGIFFVSRALIETADGVEFKSTKGKRDGEVALDRNTLRMLATHRRGQVVQSATLGGTIQLHTDRLVLANLQADPTGQVPYPPTWLSHGWQRARTAAKAPHVRLHDLRHWHATRLLDAGIPMHVVSARLRHAQVSTTANIYSHADRPADRAAATQIGLAMRALPPAKP